MKRTVVLNVVGLSPSLIGISTPSLASFMRAGQVASIVPAFPALTCTAQSNYLTGKLPAEHGIVGNGWYDRTSAEVQFWKQSNHLVQGRKVWEELRAQKQQGFTCAKLFWWYNMYSTADFSITPRPIYPADGRKVFDIYTSPMGMRQDIKKDLGEFPFPAFWGPAAGVASSQFRADAASKWIAQAAIWIEEKHGPTLSLVYLPHLDYNLQRLGPSDQTIQHDLKEIDSIVGALIDFFQKRSVQVMILSEYGIVPVQHPVHLNRIFREQGWLAIKDELGLELMDCGASRVFAVADHQVAHIYLNDRSLEHPVRQLLENTDGIAEVLATPGKIAAGLNHERAGDFIAVASERSWFTYYYWMNDQVAPDFARCVDIHRKPGYDPVELFLDPQQKWIKLRIAGKLLRKKFGFRMLMDIVPLDGGLVKGSHGRAPTDEAERPLLVLEGRSTDLKREVRSTDIYGIIRDWVLNNGSTD